MESEISGVLNGGFRAASADLPCRRNDRFALERRRQDVRPAVSLGSIPEAHGSGRQWPHLAPSRPFAIDCNLADFVEKVAVQAIARPATIIFSGDCGVDPSIRRPDGRPGAAYAAIGCV
ncbi:hypothetical protein, partial [Rhodoblastus sp.]|uniref:hypothetical protein n=1 Tax=Rhodoblastus sp. TaxID=1962975 RepID=UPI0025F63BE7